MTTPVPSKTTTAFFVQSIISFAVSLIAMSFAVFYLPVGVWERAFLGLGLLYVVTSSFTLAKCIRDQQDTSTVVNRVDQARLDKLLSDHDPFKVPVG
ncbi:MAG TPA: YiaA/YiaB family inner membrane protein [Micromonosporaceae bacterium]|nr:YiaA/YiaB family inner membrane protein [Micromonosporaceae bacterium]